MPVMDNNRIAWTYTDDRGNDWRVSAKKAFTDQLDGGNPIQGGSAAAATVKRIPQYIRMRKRGVTYGGKVYYIVVYETTADAWLETPNSAGFSYPVNGAAQTATWTLKFRAEAARDTTTQSA